MNKTKTRIKSHRGRQAGHPGRSADRSAGECGHSLQAVVVVRRRSPPKGRAATTR